MLHCVPGSLILPPASLYLYPESQLRRLPKPVPACSVLQVCYKSCVLHWNVKKQKSNGGKQRGASAIPAPHALLPTPGLLRKQVPQLRRCGPASGRANSVRLPSPIVVQCQSAAHSECSSLLLRRSVFRGNFHLARHLRSTQHSGVPLTSGLGAHRSNLGSVESAQLLPAVPT